MVRKHQVIHNQVISKAHQHGVSSCALHQYDLNGSVIRLQRIYNFLLLHAILSSVLDVYGLYYTLLYYFWH